MSVHNHFSIVRLAVIFEITMSVVCSSSVMLIWFFRSDGRSRRVIRWGYRGTFWWNITATCARNAKVRKKHNGVYSFIGLFSTFKWRSHISPGRLYPLSLRTPANPGKGRGEDGTALLMWTYLTWKVSCINYHQYYSGKLTASDWVRKRQTPFLSSTPVFSAFWIGHWGSQN